MNRSTPVLDFALSAMLIGLLISGVAVLLAAVFILGVVVGKVFVAMVVWLIAGWM